MYKKGILVFFTLIVINQYAHAEPGNGFGAGIMIGEPTGITIKYNNFPVLGFAWSLDNHFHVHCDYWLYNKQLTGPFNWYIGVGGKIRIFTDDSKNRNDEENDRDFSLGARVPLGLQFFPVPEVETFAEIVPGVALFPSTEPDFDLCIGARYYF